jgi:DNA-nicking Smr family endonuclease
MKPPRGLSAAEAELWARVARTVTPIKGRHHPPLVPSKKPVAAPAPSPRQPVSRPTPPVPPPKPPPPRVLGQQGGLDSHWERRLGKASLEPDFSLDLHGHSLDAAHARLDHGLAQARALGARLVLVVTGKPRPVDAADRGSKRGAIRAKILDWLASGPHGDAIAAVRPAQRKHGGEGALYLVMKRPRD